MPNLLNNRSLRILVLCNKMPFPPTDGGSIAMLNMLTGLSDAGNNVDVLAMQTPKHHFQINQLPQHLTSNIQWSGVAVNTDIKPIRLVANLLFSREPYNAVRFYSHEFEDALVAKLKHKQYDIVQLEGLYLSSYIDTIRRHSLALIALRAHNVEWQIWHQLYLSEPNKIKKLYKKVLANRVKRLEFKTLQNVDLLVPITETDAIKLPFANKEKVHVSPTGIVQSNFSLPRQPQNLQSFFYIGALDWEPNQQAILWFLQNVWQKFKLQNPKWTFVIAGRNAPTDFENQLKLFDVDYRGEVKDAQQFVDEQNVMVVPLLSGSGMRIKIVEAMSRSKCVITTPIGAEGIKAENGKHLFICKTADDMLSQMNAIVADNKCVGKMASEAYSFALNHYCNSNIIAELNKFYQQWV